MRTKEPRCDNLSAKSAKLGLLFCLLATSSGAVFAKLTWGAYWNWDPRQTTIFVLLLVYGAYVTLRLAITERRTRAKLSAVYALLSCAAVPFLVFVIPRCYFSLHPEPLLNSAAKMTMDATMLYTLVASLVSFSGLYFKLLYYNLNRKEPPSHE